jgi:NADPH:quinone reductase-like Zn-dependent oxidoreductase
LLQVLVSQQLKKFELLKGKKLKVVEVTKCGAPEVLQLRDVEKPIPKDNEVLIKIHAATVTSGDCRVRALNVPRGYNLMVRIIFGWSAPRQPVLGTELAGVITAIGKNVTKFKIGDNVFAFTDFSMGCYAEYKCISEDTLIVIKPTNVGFDEAAALSFGGTTVLDFFRRAKLRYGERVLINGASGAVGLAAVQLAKHAGAHVTGVCSTANVALVKFAGANQVIDYTIADFTKNGETYDVVMDTVGNAPFSRCKASLKTNGRMLMVYADLWDMLQAPWVAIISRKKIIAGPVVARIEDLDHLAALAASGEYISIIDRRYRFDQITEAHRYVDSGRKRGNVVINVAA